MARSYVYGRIRDAHRNTIYAVRVENETLDPVEVDLIAARMRDKVEARGEIGADVVVIEGATKHTLRLYGTPYSVGRVRAAMFNAALTWTPVELD